MCYSGLRRDHHVLINDGCRRNSNATTDPQEPGLPTVSDSDRRFRFVGGRVDEAANAVGQPITVGRLSGKIVKMHLIDKMGNDTCPLLSIHDMRTLRIVVDYEDGTIMFKDNPKVWHKLPTTREGQ